MVMVGAAGRFRGLMHQTSGVTALMFTARLRSCPDNKTKTQQPNKPLPVKMRLVPEYRNWPWDTFDRFLIDRPVEPQKRFCDKNRKLKAKPNRKTSFLSNALNGRK
jgi:hypothetical protein